MSGNAAAAAAATAAVSKAEREAWVPLHASSDLRLMDFDAVDLYASEREGRERLVSPNSIHTIHI
jgi:hypothetical protein